MHHFIQPLRFVLLAFMIFALQARGASAHADWQSRAQMARQIARERNDQALVAEVEMVMKSLDAAKDDSTLRSIETKVGIDPGGWSMAGQPLFHPTAEMLAGRKALEAHLKSAMAADNAAQVLQATRAMSELLGTQAGIPDARKPGKRAPIRPVTEATVAQWFVAAMKAEGPKVQQLSRGEPLPNQMLRIYAGVLSGVCDIRPSIQRHAPEALAELNKLAAGCASILIKLQQTDGHFPFPDLRGKNIRFGDMISRAMQDGKGVIHDGWVLTADPDGGTQFDTGVCGTALLKAGALFSNKAWTAAGLRAASWATTQACVSNFNYNAFSISLLAHAFHSTQEAKYLDAALHKLRVGLAPGQAANGRWIDAHNARTVYHVIIMRALGDLASVVTGDQRAEVDALTKPAIAALLLEFDAMGITVDALPELLALRNLHPADVHLKQTIEQMAATIIEKSTKGDRAKFVVSPDQFAGLARVWR